MRLSLVHLVAAPPPAWTFLAGGESSDSYDPMAAAADAGIATFVIDDHCAAPLVVRGKVEVATNFVAQAARVPLVHQGQERESSQTAGEPATAGGEARSLLF